MWSEPGALTWRGRAAECTATTSRTLVSCYQRVTHSRCTRRFLSLVTDPGSLPRNTIGPNSIHHRHVLLSNFNQTVFVRDSTGDSVYIRSIGTRSIRNRLPSLITPSKTLRYHAAASHHHSSGRRLPPPPDSPWQEQHQDPQQTLRDPHRLPPWLPQRQKPAHHATLPQLDQSQDPPPPHSATRPIILCSASFDAEAHLARSFEIPVRKALISPHFCPKTRRPICAVAFYRHSRFVTRLASRLLSATTSWHGAITRCGAQPQTL